jgi:hypothetical protein
LSQVLTNTNITKNELKGVIKGDKINPCIQGNSRLKFNHKEKYSQLLDTTKTSNHPYVVLSKNSSNNLLLTNNNSYNTSVLISQKTAATLNIESDQKTQNKENQEKENSHQMTKMNTSDLTSYRKVNTTDGSIKINNVSSHFYLDFENPEKNDNHREDYINFTNISETLAGVNLIMKNFTDITLGVFDFENTIKEGSKENKEYLNLVIKLSSLEQDLENLKSNCSKMLLDKKIFTDKYDETETNLIVENTNLKLESDKRMAKYNKFFEISSYNSSCIFEYIKDCKYMQEIKSKVISIRTSNTEYNESICNEKKSNIFIPNSHIKKPSTDFYNNKIIVPFNLNKERLITYGEDMEDTIVENEQDSIFNAKSHKKSKSCALTNDFFDNLKLKKLKKEESLGLDNIAECGECDESKLQNQYGQACFTKDRFYQAKDEMFRFGVKIFIFYMLA